MLMEKGYAVRGLVRNPKSDDSKAIAATGVEMVAGDVSDLNSVLATMNGCDSVIHSAAMLGGPQQTLTEGFTANAIGTMNVMAAAHRLELTPCVQLLTTTYFNMWKNTLTEKSPLCLEAVNRDPYSLSKRFAFLEGDARAREGQDIRFVIPGGAFGPSPAVTRAMTAPSMNTLIVSAIKKEIDEIVSFPIPWVYTDDCAWVAVAALEKGVRGERYIAHGRADKDVGGMDLFCNTVLEEAGSPHRVRAVPPNQLDNPEIRKKYGDSWADLGKTRFPKPWSDSTFTQKRLGYRPTDMRDGIRTTLDWMHSIKLI
jgi:nucleoside-diphosphate-sugar epimerase